jgi:hypothetical protein
MARSGETRDASRILVFQTTEHPLGEIKNWENEVEIWPPLGCYDVWLL